MSTKTFSARVDEQKLKQADLLAREEFGISFAQYCGTILIDSVCETGTFSQTKNLDANKKQKAYNYLKNFSPVNPSDSSIGKMSDEEIKSLIASRYA